MDRISAKPVQRAFVELTNTGGGSKSRVLKLTGGDLDLDLTYSAPQQPGSALDKPHLSLHYVFLLYRQFGRWFCVTAPTSIIAGVALLATDWKIREIYAAIPRAELPYHWREIALTYALRLGGFFVAWFLGCFALAAIATIASGLDEDDEAAAWRSDSFQRAREHLLGIFGVAVFTFCAFLLGVAAMGIVDAAVIRLIGWTRVVRYSAVAGVLGYVIVAGVACWYGMAIPLLVRGEIAIWAALKRSVKISNGYEGFLFLLVLESLAGSYVAWYAAHYGIALLMPVALRNTVWHGWIVYFASILASAAVEPPMFIGFSVLADAYAGDSGLAPRSQQPPQID